jgi:hypothetical protein
MGNHLEMIITYLLGVVYEKKTWYNKNRGEKYEGYSGF